MEVGSLGRLRMILPGALLRSRDAVMRGAGPGSWTMGQLAKDLPKMLEAVVGFEDVEVRVEKLADVERVWEEKEDGKGRVVFVPEGCGV